VAALVFNGAAAVDFDLLAPSLSESSHDPMEPIDSLSSPPPLLSFGITGAVPSLLLVACACSDGAL